MATLLEPIIAVGGAGLWVSDDGRGGYVNPVLYADYSDPDVIRVGADFWMIASSFNCTPGIPILHSTDLVNWTLVGHALPHLPHPRYAAVQPGCGVWAPAIRFHQDWFWIFFPTPDEGIYVTTASDPRGDWSTPHLLQPGKGLIDPCPLWDDDGRAYLVFAYAGSRAGFKHRIDIREMDPTATRLIGPSHTVFHDPTHHPTAEGPKFHKRDGYYYILAPAGGVATGWQLALRSRHVYGPYEHRIVLAQGDSDVNGPHQGAMVDTPDGQEWFVHFQELQPYGRIVHLQPVTWQNGWPLVGEPSPKNPGTGTPVSHHRKPDVAAVKATAEPATSDEFDQPRLGLQWQWHANSRPEWASLDQAPGWLRLAARPVHPTDLALTPHLLLQKFPAPAFSVQTRVRLASIDTVPPNGIDGGIAIVGLQSASLVLARHPDGVKVILRRSKMSPVVRPVTTDTVEFRLACRSGGACTFSYRGSDRRWVELPGRFQAVEGMWIGAKVGLFAAGLVGYVDFNYFRFEPLSTVGLTPSTDRETVLVEPAHRPASEWRAAAAEPNTA